MTYIDMIEESIRKFIAREVPESVEHQHKVMISELAHLFFMDKYAVLDHLRQCNEHLEQMIKVSPW